MRTARSRAPGRVNVIGEHTDYNEGFVLPCAIAYDTQVRAAERPDRMVTLRARVGDPATFDLDGLPQERSHLWSDYVRGVFIELQRAGRALRGMDMQISGAVPIGAGLSSSASLEIAVALAALDLARAEMAPLDIALAAQRAEIEHVGTRCGIMDQFAVMHARAGHVMLLDTRSLTCEQIPFPRELGVIVCNTMVKHELSTGAYNERRAECERATELLRARYPDIRALRDVSESELERAADLLPGVLLARARHVVRENERVLRAAASLRAGDFTSLGELLYVSHESLRDDYAVSCRELDVMVRIASEFDGTVGARMTGAGFGGCTITLVRRERADAFRAYAAGAYRRETGIMPELYDGTPSEGACVVDD